MRLCSRLLSLALLFGAGLLAWAGPFLEKPYLQIGTGREDSLALCWHGPDRDERWAVAVRRGAGRPWGPAIAADWFRVAVPSVPAHRVYSAPLTVKWTGGRFQYRVTLDGQEVFQATAPAPKKPGETLRVAVAGDLATPRPGSRNIALALQAQRPELVLVPGDIVYEDGRIGEYRGWFFPVYNADKADPAVGAPLLRETPFVGVLGNHDVGERGARHPLATEPDSFAYYLYWNQPLNGPPLRAGGPGAPLLKPGPDWTWEGFLAAAGERYPTMGNFSFERGGAHWTVLDSNRHVPWQDPALQDWLGRDLAAAAKARWRFVAFHHPPFNFADGNAYQDEWMGRLWPLFERHRVDLVLTGHIHTYVRSRPLHFKPDPASLAELDPMAGRDQLRGELTWDAAFDGRVRTRAKAPILVVSGGGGAHLHLKGRGQKLNLKPSVAVHEPDQHSISVLDIGERQVLFRQVGEDGRELDRFVLTR